MNTPVRVKCHLKKNDLVVARSGSAAGGGKQGKILQVLPKRMSAIVEGLNFVYRHMRKSQDNPKGAIVRKEAPLPISKLMLYCPRCKKGVKCRRERDEKKRVHRVCVKCGNKFD